MYFLCLLLTVIWVKEDRARGRAERGIESQNEEDVGEEKWRYGEARRTRRVSIPKGNQVTKLLSINNYRFHSYKFRFIGINDEELR